MKQLTVVERWYLLKLSTAKSPPLDGNDAIGADFRTHAGIAVEPAVDDEAMFADGPGDKILRVIEAGVLPRYPAVRHAMRIESEDQGVRAH